MLIVQLQFLASFDPARSPPPLPTSPRPPPSTPPPFPLYVCRSTAIFQPTAASRPRSTPLVQLYRLFYVVVGFRFGVMG